MTPSQNPSSHACASSGMTPTLRQERFDSVEQRVLDLMRLIFSRRANALPRFAAKPADVARDHFGAEVGPLILQATEAVIQQMSLARRDTFHYTNPYCAGCADRLTAEEAHLLRIIKELRLGRRGSAMISGLMICEAEPIDPLIAAGAALAAQLPPHH